MKPQFSTRIVSLAALVPLFVVPLAGHADAAMDACIDAFISSTLPKEQPVKIRNNISRDSMRISAHAMQWIEVRAKITRTGEQIAKATCSVARDGTVLALDGVPAE